MIPLDRIEQALWGLGRETQRLEEERADLRLLWDDSAASAVNGRHLDPLQEAAARLLNSLRRQGEHLATAQQRLALIREHALTAGRANAAADEALRRTETELRDAERYESVSVGLQWTVQRVLLQQVHEAITRANACAARS